MADLPRALDDAIDPQWYDMGNEFLRARQLDQTELATVIIGDALPQHLQSIAADGLRKQIENRKAWESRAMTARKLGVVRSTLHRFVKGETVCDLKLYLTSLLFFGWELPVFHGSHEMVVFDLTARLVHFIRTEKLNETCDPPSQEQLACVHFFTRYPDSPTLYTAETFDPKLLADAYEAVLREINARFPTSTIASRHLADIVEDWCEPYVLLRIALDYHDWDLFDEDPE